jgi:hypothetical protein
LGGLAADLLGFFLNMKSAQKGFSYGSEILQGVLSHTKKCSPLVPRHVRHKNSTGVYGGLIGWSKSLFLLFADKSVFS